MFWLTHRSVNLIICLWPCDRCRKLPRALKDWQAFQDLKQTIDDFNESCPLLELMANKAMKQRHWDRIAGLTGHTFDMESETFSLRNIMEAPLLKHKEDIEVCCCFAYCQILIYNYFRGEVLQRFTFFSLGCVHRCSQRERHWSQTEGSCCRLEYKRTDVRELQESRRTFAARRQHVRDCGVNGGQFNGAWVVNEQQVRLILYLGREDLAAYGS